MQAATEKQEEFLSGFLLSGAFGVFGVIQIATEDLTGIGMLAIAAFSAWSTHAAKKKKVDYDNQVEKIKAETEQREKALEARVKMLVAGIKCDHHDCPVLEVANGKIGPMDRIKLPEDFPFDQIKAAKPDEPTEDIP